MVIDHIDRNTLNNIRTNLRVISSAENAQNRTANNGRALPENTVLYRTKGPNKYGVCINFGSYKTIEEAQLAVSNFRREHYPWSKEARKEGFSLCPCLKDVLPKGVAG